MLCSTIRLQRDYRFSRTGRKYTLALLGKAFAPYLQIPEISEALITINCGLALFNLLPLFP